MLIAALLAVAAVAATIALIFVIGDRDVRRGRIRSIRRIRAARRRALRPLLGRLERTAAVTWTRPRRRAVAGQLRRIADQVERASAAAGGFVAAQGDLALAIERLQGAGPAARAEARPSPERRARDRVTGGGWLTALALALTAAALAGANGWTLHRYVLPGLADPGILPAGGLDLPTVAAAAGALPFFLGLAYFALNAAGRALGYRVLSVVVALLVLVIAGLEAIAVVMVLEESTVAAPTWWGGVILATLLGGMATLAPPTVAALAHAAIDRLDRWVAARGRRAAGRAAARQDRLSGRLRDTVDRAASSLDAIRAELGALSADPAGRLLLHPGERPTVERTGAVLRRLAVAVERDVDGPWTEQPGPGDVLIRVLADLGALLVWCLAAAGALTILAAGLQYGIETGTSGLMTGGAFAAVAVLLLGGLLLRSTLSSPAWSAGPLARGAAVLLLGVATAALGLAVGTLAGGVEGGFFEGRPEMAGAWLTLLVLVAALASVRLGEGISATGAIITFLLATAAWLVLAGADAALAVTDRVLAGARRRAPTPRPPPGRGARPAVGALGGGRERR